jgi:hypothetical protein
VIMLIGSLGVFALSWKNLSKDYPFAPPPSIEG